MKKLLTLLLVFSFAFSFSAVKYIPEKKVEKFLIEKTVEKTDVVSVNLVIASNPFVFREKTLQRDCFYQHRFNQNPYLVFAKAKFIDSKSIYNHTFITKLPDKLS